ncbi:MAG TPA: dihydrolipoamide acetyltransferase family protein [candidate division Zixibacteria bacterium]|nr:dihydrolipoamide acetyltransferase family protein [candidate division Zixibacteria bacterium]
MALDVLVPQMGESVLEGTILEWKVKIGDKVKLNQPLVELMTDKVNVEIPAEVAGILTQQLAKEGDVVPVGTRIAVIDDGSSVSSDSKPVEKAAPAQSAPAAAAAPSAPAKPKAEVKGTAGVGKGKMAPKVKMLVRQYSLDPSTITPTGKNGIVTVEDVMREVEGRSSSAGFTVGPIPTPPTPMAATGQAAPAAATAAEAPAQPLVKVEIPKFEPLPANLRETRQPLQGIRKMISDHMVKSVQTSPHVTTFEDIDMTELVAYRNEIKGDFKRTYGANITFMPFIIKACCVALKEFPKINGSRTEKEIILKHFYNIGIAVAREEGLIVPVIKDADKKTIVELAVEIQSIGERARKNQLMPDDVSGGTFSLTNAGMFGATASTPIINQPQVAILGIHAIVKRPWVVNGEITIRDISSFGMSFDHRLIDGHTAVQFLHRVHEYLADIKKLTLQLR